MPNRLVSLAILTFWVVAAVALFTRDILPTIVTGTPPDLRTVTQFDEKPRQTRWNILVVDDAEGNLRSVGQATTISNRKRDGFVRMSSEAWLDSGLMLRGTRLTQAEGDRLEILGDYEVDSTGNLYHFRAAVRDGPPPRPELITIEGQLEENSILVKAKGFLPTMTWTQRFPYQPRGMIQNGMGPLDRMPGLNVGQRWESRVVSPLTGQVVTARAEVTRMRSILWDEKLVNTLEVVTRTMSDGVTFAPPISAKTWVRPDGLVLRQEIPFPLLRLVMERVPDHDTERGIKR